MTAKEYLRQVQPIKLQKQVIQEEIDEMTIRAGYGTSSRVARNLSGTNHNSPMENTILDPKNWELDKRLKEKREELASKEIEIMDVIYSVEDTVYQNILILRYVRCLGWEQIAWRMNYELSRLYDLHGEALKLVRIPKKIGVNRS